MTETGFVRVTRVFSKNYYETIFFTDPEERRKYKDNGEEKDSV